MRVLAGDIGGTKTDFPGLEEIAEDFLSEESRRPVSATFGVAGPVVAGRAKVTKLPWSIDERRLGIPRVRLVNDFIAAALGIPHLSRRRSVVLVPGRAEPDGPIAVIGAGT